MIEAQRVALPVHGLRLLEPVLELIRLKVWSDSKPDVRILRIEGSLVVDGLDLGGVEGYPLIHITAREERTVKPSRFEKGYDITFLVF